MKEETLLYRLLGTNDINFIIACLIFAFIGVIVHLLLNVLVRGENTGNFSFKKLWYENKERLLASNLLNVLLILLTIRFSSQVLHFDINEFIAFFIGLGSDSLSRIYKKLLQKYLPS